MLSPLAALATQLRAGDVVLAVALLLIGLWSGCRLLIATRQVPLPEWLHSLCALAWQIGALLSLEQAYEFTRGHITHTNTNDVAFLHAYGVFDFELRHGMFIEQRLQHVVLGWGPAMTLVDYFYVFAHVTVTIGVLIWVYIRHRHHYPFVRNLLMVTTAIALVVFYAYPMAPPRFLTVYGFIDPAITNRLVDAGGAQPDSYTYNPYAAMPSLHVGYALVSTWAILLCTRRTMVQMLAVVYPIAMSFAVLASANHWVLDIVGAIVTVLGAGIIVGVLSSTAAALHRVVVAASGQRLPVHDDAPVASA